MLYSIAFLLSLSLSDVIALPNPTVAGGLTMNLKRRARPLMTRAEKGLWLKTQRENIHAKYGNPLPSTAANRKRASGENLLINQGTDASFLGTVAIGTPAVSYDVILDTGSADLWVADSSCTTGCDGISTFDTSDSSTYVNSSTAFSIQYGSGAAAGVLGSDVVQLAGSSVSNQVFAVCDEVSSGLLSNPTSGLMGLAWQTIATSGATPFWQSLAASGAWDENVMSFQLTRFLNVQGAQELENGGTFTMGFLNTSLYTGDVEYTSLVSSTYWLVELTGLTVQGSSSSVGSGSDSYAAIDTGTTLVGGPSDLITDFYSLIDGSAAGTGDLEGYYTYPCDTTINTTVSFGGKAWAISNDDFLLEQVSESLCVGAFFEFSSGDSGPAWIFGDTFLKNVYSVFRYDPAAVGFAELSTTATAMNGDIDAAVPSATIGSAAAVVSATTGVDSSNRQSDSGVSLESSSRIFTLLVACAAVLLLS